MIEYEHLKAASEIADISPNVDTPDWCEAEGVDYQGLMTFAAEHSESVLASGQVPFEGNPLSQVLLAMGMVMGIRYANILNQEVQA